MKPQLEKQIERNVCDYAHDAGMLVYKFATEAYIKMQDQRALIQQLRQLIATIPEKKSDKKSD